MKKYYFFIITFILLFSIFTINSVSSEPIRVTSTVEILYVGGSGPGNYSSIQDAIDNASDGDTVFVYCGVYCENVLVDKSITLHGEDKENTIIDGSKIDDVIYITADSVIVSGFSLQNSGDKQRDSGIDARSNNNYFFDNILSENYYGIYLASCSNNTLYSNDFTMNYNAIMLHSLNFPDDENCNILNNKIYLNERGIYIWKGINFNVSNNFIYSNDDFGIDISETENITICSNEISDNARAIDLHRANKNNILKNTISNNVVGINLYQVNNNTINDNSFSNNGLFLYPNCYFNEIYDNFVNNKPLVYLEDESNVLIQDAGQVILNNCNKITVKNIVFSKSSYPIQLLNSSECLICNNSFFDNAAGISALGNNNSIKNNNFNNNNIGININPYNAFNNQIENNTFLNNEQAIFAVDSCKINNNYLQNNSYGVFLSGLIHPYSSYIKYWNITNNCFLKNGCGVLYRDGGNHHCELVDNSFTYDGIVIEDNDVILEGNTVNGKPIMILKDESDYNIEEAGQIILVNCENITIQNQNLSNTAIGIDVYNSNNCKISNNIINQNSVCGIRFRSSSNNIILNNILNENGKHRIDFYSYFQNIDPVNPPPKKGAIQFYYSNNYNIIKNNDINFSNHGIELRYSNHNNISKNTVSNNIDGGIKLHEQSNKNYIIENDILSNLKYGLKIKRSWDIGWGYGDCKNNLIYHNNFIENEKNANAKGRNYFNSSFGEGNYWDDYNGIDSNGDGIGDTPYNISGGDNKDFYPLMEPYGDYEPPDEIEPELTVLLKDGVCIGEVSSTVKNIGTADAKNVNLSLFVEYGFIGHEKQKSKTFTVLNTDETSETVIVDGLKGFGKITVTATATADNAETVGTTASGWIIGRFIIFFVGGA